MQGCLRAREVAEPRPHASNLYRTEKRRTIMAYVISSDCISCGTCEGECPVGAISDGGEKYVIDAALCTDCGSCAGVCPTEAISPE